MKRRAFTLSLCLAALGVAGCGQTLNASAGKLYLSPIKGLDSPLQIEDTGQGTVWIVEKTGKIRTLKGNRPGKTVLDLSQEVSDGGEQGLLGVAVSPNFKDDGAAYLYLTNRQGDGELRRYQGNKDKLQKSSKQILLEVNQPEDNHNGGGLRFGPDGMLYLGLGDGGGAGDEHGEKGNAQNRQVLLGKILRIDPKGSPYTIPQGNPFSGSSGRPEIWAWGLRNPWRFSFDRKGRLWIGDVGQSRYEEINRLTKDQAGANLGWRVYEGSSRYSPGEEAPGSVKPVLSYSHSGGRCSVVGGVVSEGEILKGRYLYGDTCDGKLRHLSQGKEKSTGLKVPSLVSIDQDRQGQIYLSSLSGTVYLLKAK